MREDLNNIKNMLDKAVLLQEKVCPYLIQVQQLFLDFDKKLNLHLLLEENIVFPLISAQMAQGPNYSLQPLLQKLMHEHQDDRLILKNIFDLLAKTKYNKASELFTEMEKFSSKLQEHSQYEDDVIFCEYNKCVFG